MKVKTLGLSEKFGERLVLQLSGALGFQESITADELSLAREMAFSSSDPETFAWHYLRSECFSKWEEGEASNLEQLALEKYSAVERWVSMTNARLVDPWSRPWLDVASFTRARHIVSRILGRFPWEKFPRACEWSSGASTQLKRRSSQVENKWALSAHITEGALPYYEAFCKWAGREELRRETVLRPGNKVTTVPKNWKIDRVIAIEPDWNMFFQKGVGSLIRSRLQRFGILKPEAQSIARRMARKGSVDQSLATLDLASASDCVSLALCEALIPEDWLRVIFDLRSPSPAGSDRPYAMVSSMGNGYTFELETLLFYALACSLSRLGDDQTHVYGDDIICPTEVAPELGVLLLEAGFFLNEDKSFASGPFRESCGGHYYVGEDVTPFYCKRRPRHAAELCVMGNHIIEWCGNRRWNSLEGFSKVYSAVRRAVPKRFRGPYGYDGVLWQDWDSATPYWHADYQAWRSFRFIPVYWDEAEELAPEGALLQAIWRHSADWKGAEFYRPIPRTYKAKPYTICRTQWNALPAR